ncbi:hypothetical protein JCM11251_000114 [Rhodosporidiobolus azoricus]
MQPHQAPWTTQEGAAAEGAFLGGALVSLNDNSADSADLAPPVSPYFPSTSLASGSRRNNSNGGREPGKPPRPMNAWLLFRTAQLKQIQDDNPGLRKSQGELSKIISQMWKTCDPEVRSGYEALAKERKLEHARAYPDYRYAPSPKTGPSSKARKSPASSRKPSLRLSPSQVSRSASFSLSPSSTPTGSQHNLSAESLYAHQFEAYEPPPSSSSSSGESYAPVPTPANITSYASPPTGTYTATRTAGLPAGPSGMKWLPALPPPLSPQEGYHQNLRTGSVAGLIPGQPQQRRYMYEMEREGGRVPASAPATVTRFKGSTLGLTLAPQASDGEEGYESTYQHFFPPVPPTAATSSFPAYVSSSQYLSPPATAASVQFSSSDVESSSLAYHIYRQPPSSSLATYPPPPALAQPPRPQGRTMHEYQSPTVTPSKQQWNQCNPQQYDDVPPSPFALPPQVAQRSYSTSIAETPEPAQLAQSSLAQVAAEHAQHQQQQQQIMVVESGISPHAAYSRPSSFSASAPFSSTRPQLHPRTMSYESASSYGVSDPHSRAATASSSASSSASLALNPSFPSPQAFQPSPSQPLRTFSTGTHLQLHHPVPVNPAAYVSPLTHVHLEQSLGLAQAAEQYNDRQRSGIGSYKEGGGQEQPGEQDGWQWYCQDEDGV